MKVKITWYGRCCFLIEMKEKRFLIDPHDDFDSVFMGTVRSDYTLISSTWHDHGNIGASPRAVIVSEPGVTEVGDFVITGVETKDSKGMRNIVFNIRHSEASVTNFADLGDPKSLEKISFKDAEVLGSTDIAFVRPNMVPQEPDITSAELALRVCNPKIIIPHHFYPEKFIQRVGAPKEMSNYYRPQIENMLERISYKKTVIDGYAAEVDLEECKEKTVILFSDIHAQVAYSKE